MTGRMPLGAIDANTSIEKRKADPTKKENQAHTKKRKIDIADHETDLNAPNTSSISSFQSSQILNHSQETNLTEPENQDNYYGVRRRANVKQQADVLRLRLRYALYKIETNQVEVPLSRLEVRSKATSARPNSSAHSSALLPSPKFRENHSRHPPSLPAGNSTSFHEAAPRQPPSLPATNSTNFHEAAPRQVHTVPSSQRELPRHRVNRDSGQRSGGLIPYSMQKRRMSLSSASESSDIEIEIPQKNKKSGWRRELEVARQAEMRRKATISLTGSFSAPFGNEVYDEVDENEDYDYDGDDDVEEVDVGRKRGHVNGVGSSDEIEGAAGGLLELGRRGSMPV